MTLIELMVGITLLSVVALGFGTIYGAAQTSLVEAMAAEHVDRELSLVMEHVTWQLRPALAAEWRQLPGGGSEARQLVITVPDPHDPTQRVQRWYEWMKDPTAPRGQVWWIPDPQTSSQRTLLADRLTGMQVAGENGPDLTAASSTATVILDTVSRGRTIHRTSSVRLRGWTLPSAERPSDLERAPAGVDTPKR